MFLPCVPESRHEELKITRMFSGVLDKFTTKTKSSRSHPGLSDVKSPESTTDVDEQVPGMKLIVPTLVRPQTF